MSLSNLELARMRRVADAHLPDGVVISRPTYNSDGQGGRTTTYATVYNGPGRVSPINSVNGADAVVADRLGGAQGLWVTVPWHVEVRLEDRVVSGGRTYEVRAEDAPRAYPISHRVLCAEVA